MTGYHYTSWENWKKIKKEGLKPYMITHPDILKEVPTILMGIWVWTRNHKNFSNLGNVIWQCTKEGTTRVIKLSFEYDKEDLFYWGNKKLIMAHTSSLVAVKSGEDTRDRHRYHNKERAFLVVRTIKPEEITVVADYNLLKLIK